MNPVLGREVVEGEQLLGVGGDLGGRLRPLDPVVGLERLDSSEGVLAIGGVSDLRYRLAC